MAATWSWPSCPAPAALPPSRNGTSFMPQIGQLPGSSWITFGCMPQVHNVPSGTSASAVVVIPPPRSHSSKGSQPNGSAKTRPARRNPSSTQRTGTNRFRLRDCTGRVG